MYGSTMAPVASPCISLCRLDPEERWCIGCGRSLTEIAAWPQASDNERRAIIERSLRRLPGSDASPRNN